MTLQQLPTNGETKVINGVSYVYTSANNSWTVGVAVPQSTEIVYSESLYISSSNGITFSDGTVQTTASSADSWVRNRANAAFLQANSAYNKANSANVLAQSAYNQANTGTTLAQAAFNVANNVSGGSALDSYARITANTASLNTIYTQGVDAGQNTRISIIEGVNTTQNTNITNATTLAQGAYNTANTGATTGKAIAMAMVFGG